MKKLLAIMLTLCLALAAVSASADIFDTLNDVMNALNDATEESNSTTTETATEATDTQGVVRGNELAFVAENILYTGGSSYVSGYYSAEIYNGTDENVTFASYGNKANIYTLDGTLAKEGVYISVYPTTIAPGESAFINTSFSLSVGTDVPTADTQVYFDVNIDLDDKKGELEPRLSFRDAGINKIKEYSWSTRLSDALECVIVNDTGSDVRGLHINYGLYDSKGNFIYADRTYLDDKFVLHEGDTINLSMPFWSWVNDYLSNNSETIGSVILLITPY